MLDLSQQCFVIARLADYCDYRHLDPVRARNPALYLWDKLKEIEEPLYRIKQGILNEAIRNLLRLVHEQGAHEKDLAEFRQLLDHFLSRGDFADASFHLTRENLRDLDKLKWAEQYLHGLRVQRCLKEEEDPSARLGAEWTKLVDQLYDRLEFPMLEKALRRKPLTQRRLRFILRRCRFNTANYCAVFHVPIKQDDSFTPFIMPRVEALVSANKRFLRKIGW